MKWNQKKYMQMLKKRSTIPQNLRYCLIADRQCFWLLIQTFGYVCSLSTVCQLDLIMEHYSPLILRSSKGTILGLVDVNGYSLNTMNMECLCSVSIQTAQINCIFAMSLLLQNIASKRWWWKLLAPTMGNSALSAISCLMYETSVPSSQKTRTFQLPVGVSYIACLVYQHLMLSF